MNTTPVSLLERLRDPAAEKAAWDRFVELFTPLLFGCSRRLGVPAEDAADLVQDVFMKLVQELPRFHYDGSKSFRAYLYTLLRNQWYDTCRRRSVLPVQDHGGSLPEPVLPDPVALLAEAEYLHYLLARAFELMQDEFEPITCDAFREFVLNGRPAGEVARALGISVNAVYVAGGRVRRRLRQALQGLVD